MSLLAKSTIWIQYWMVKDGIGEEWMVGLGGGKSGRKELREHDSIPYRVQHPSRYPDNRRLRLWGQLTFKTTMSPSMMNICFWVIQIADNDNTANNCNDMGWSLTSSHLLNLNYT